MLWFFSIHFTMFTISNWTGWRKSFVIRGPRYKEVRSNIGVRTISLLKKTLYATEAVHNVRFWETQCGFLAKKAGLPRECSLLTGVTPADYKVLEHVLWDGNGMKMLLRSIFYSDAPTKSPLSNSTKSREYGNFRAQSNSKTRSVSCALSRIAHRTFGVSRERILQHLEMKPHQPYLVFMIVLYRGQIGIWKCL